MEKEARRNAIKAFEKSEWDIRAKLRNERFELFRDVILPRYSKKLSIKEADEKHICPVDYALEIKLQIKGKGDAEYSLYFGIGTPYRLIIGHDMGDSHFWLEDFLPFFEDRIAQIIGMPPVACLSDGWLIVLPSIALYRGDRKKCLKAWELKEQMEKLVTSVGDANQVLKKVAEIDDFICGLNIEPDELYHFLSDTFDHAEAVRLSNKWKKESGWVE